MSAATVKSAALATIADAVGPRVLADFEKKLEDLETNVKKEMKGKSEEEIDAEYSSRAVKLGGGILRGVLDEANLVHRYFDYKNPRWWADGIATSALDTIFKAIVIGAGLYFFSRKVEGEVTETTEQAPEANLFSTATDRPMRERKSA